MLVTYVSGHGFGHSTRTAEVLRVVRALRPELPLAIVTKAPEGLFREAIPGDITYRKVGLDVGLAQADALGIDLDETIGRLNALEELLPALVEAEARWLGAIGARLVLADIPAAAFDVAARAGVPSIGLGNFSWDWIYGHLARARPELARSAALARGSAGNAGLLLELPFAGDLSAFPRRERIPLVARQPRRSRAEAREQLGLGHAPRVVLLSFGGLGLDALDLSLLSEMPGTVFLAESAGRGSARNIRRFERSELRSKDLGYLDLVAASDVVVTKPGYGIVTDALACGTRIVYTERGDFPEYPILVREMKTLIPCEHVSNGDLLAGRLEGPIRRVMEHSVPPPPRLDGAAEAARRIVEWMGGPTPRPPEI